MDTKKITSIAGIAGTVLTVLAAVCTVVGGSLKAKDDITALKSGKPIDGES